MNYPRCCLYSPSGKWGDRLAFSEDELCVFLP